MGVSNKSLNRVLTAIGDSLPTPARLAFHGVLTVAVGTVFIKTGNDLIKFGDRRSVAMGRGAILLASSLPMFLAKEIFIELGMQSATSLANYWGLATMTAGIALTFFGAAG
ncbi:MAG: hypothetical protein K2Y01_05700 [Rhabdochlamydiaceae bacterium]|nr:hypothetical protein [Rhabdochlamydiaceae bacterium]